jgi:CDP-6-deoxy-D-xylo-4-hexulose-3-dehydrase
MNEGQIRSEIFEHIKHLIALRQNETFIPGKSPVPYAGRVFDEKEMIALVDASLDFWLTTGRYAEKFEKDLAEFLGLKYCLLTNSGSSATR